MKGFKLTEVRPRIFFLNFEDSYNMAMHFLRYQECYESPSPRFRGKCFNLLEFMEWYSKKFGNGNFTYMTDWAGFNIPGQIIKDIHAGDPGDFNKYDEVMGKVYDKCETKYPDGKFYVIGAVGEKFAMRHEVAHGFFYTQPEYKKEMTKLVRGLKPKTKEKIYAVLKNIGYTPQVYIDECQAYMSTGVPVGFKVNVKKQQTPFVELFHKYYNA